MDVLGKIYTNIVTVNNINPGKIMCNDYLLEKAITRYSRDVFGERRLSEKINYLQATGRITQSQNNNLSEFDDYGLKINSQTPYIHRKLSNLLYWLSILKPFAIYPNNNSAVMPLGVAFEFHNEYISYLLAIALLRVYGKTLTLHKNRHLFYDFLYSLHFRNLSRSSLEFFLYAYIV